MDRKLVIIILFFLIFLAVFIGAMLRAEHQNIQELREEYPELSEEAYSYRMDAFKLWAVRLPLTFLIPLIFLFTGFSQKLSLATGNGRSLFLNGLLFGLVYFGIIYLINLPFSFYGSFILRHRYGLTDQTVLRWIEISAKGFLVNNGMLALFLWVPYYLIYKIGRASCRERV